MTILLTMPFVRSRMHVLREDRWRPGERSVAEESAVALTYNRVTHAVMMATPADLEDFAVGFSLAEDVVSTPGEIEDVEIVEPRPGAIECRMWVGPDRMSALAARRRSLAGATGCGMCGLESLEAALRPAPAVPDGVTVTGEAVLAAVAAMLPAQTLGQETRAVHAAGFWTQDEGLVTLREDVGRHNALDKLAGALARSGRHASEGIVVLTSRLSVEMVQKAARMGAAIVAGVSAPTALALRAAEGASMTVIGVARADGFELFTGSRRIARPVAD